MDRDFGRRHRRALRELADLAWERELSAELTTLAASFDEWKAGRLGPHDLSDRIHRFHDDAARGLYSLYTRVHSSQLVARAVGRGVLTEADVPADLLGDLARTIEYYRLERQSPTDDAESPSGE
jgi:hypothetical protein